MRRLIVNADDFGLTEGINRAIYEGHAHGIVTSTTLMANSPAFAPAVKLARENPPLAVGCHVVLVDGEPVSEPANVISLLDGSNAQPRFRGSLLSFSKDMTNGRISEHDTYTEALAQFRKLQSQGVVITHFDTHKHTHMFPRVLRPLLRAASEAGIRAVRNPFEAQWSLSYGEVFTRPKLWMRYCEVSLLRRYHAVFRRAVADAGLFTTDGSFGIVVTGSLDAKLFCSMVGRMPEGTWELVCHPGYWDQDLAGARTRLKRSREAELAVLMSEEAGLAIKAKGLQLISYRDVSQA